MRMEMEWLSQARLRLADWQMYLYPVTYAAASGITKVGEKAYLFG